ncbi:zinc finger domain-containing protein [Mycolicibacter sinensis]
MTTTPDASRRRYTLANQLQADVRAVACPGRSCQAPAGEPCRGAGGIGFHAPRFADAMKQEFPTIDGEAYDPDAEPEEPQLSRPRRGRARQIA